MIEPFHQFNRQNRRAIIEEESLDYYQRLTERQAERYEKAKEVFVALQKKREEKAELEHRLREKERILQNIQKLDLQQQRAFIQEHFWEIIRLPASIRNITPALREEVLCKVKSAVEQYRNSLERAAENAISAIKNQYQRNPETITSVFLHDLVDNAFNVITQQKNGEVEFFNQTTITLQKYAHTKMDSFYRSYSAMQKEIPKIDFILDVIKRTNQEIPNDKAIELRNSLDPESIEFKKTPFSLMVMVKTEKDYCALENKKGSTHGVFFYTKHKDDFIPTILINATTQEKSKPYFQRQIQNTIDHEQMHAVFHELELSYKDWRGGSKPAMHNGEVRPRNRGETEQIDNMRDEIFARLAAGDRPSFIKQAMQFYIQKKEELLESSREKEHFRTIVTSGLDALYSVQDHYTPQEIMYFLLTRPMSLWKRDIKNSHYSL